jgi:hypothetical protein
MVPPQREPPPDLAVQPLSFPLRHGQVPGERVEQLDVLLRLVNPLPVVVADADDLEEPARLDVVLGKFAGSRAPLAGRLPRADLVVDVLDLVEERVAALGEHVSRRPDGQVAVGPQRVPGSLIADRRVDPVPGRGRVHEPVGLSRRPFLELTLYHLHRPLGEILPGGRG